MDINDPAILAEVEQAFALYESALVTNNVAELDRLFWDSPHTIRYGTAENLYGIDQIREFRGARPATGLARTLARTVITTFGADFATASTLFTRAPGKTGRQMQSWVRTEHGWRVVAASVSVIDTP